MADTNPPQASIAPAGTAPTDREYPTSHAHTVSPVQQQTGQPAAAQQEQEPISTHHEYHHPHLPHIFHKPEDDGLDVGVEAHMDAAQLETAVVEVQTDETGRDVDRELDRDVEKGVLADTIESASATPTAASSEDKPGATSAVAEAPAPTAAEPVGPPPAHIPDAELTPAQRAERMYARYSPAKKRLFCVILALCSLLSPIATTGCLTALAELAATFHTSGSVINISNGLYTGAMGVSAFLWGVTGVLGGRRVVLVPSVVTFTAFSLGSALSPNLAAFFVFRILSGFSGTGLLVCGPAVVGDIYRPTERGTALAWIMSGTLIGPAIGPTIGGIIVTYTSWRNIYWLQTGLAALASVLTVLFLPETSHTRRWDSIPADRRVTACLAAFNPVRMFRLFSRPDLFLVALASSSLIWTMYAFFAPILYVINPRLHFTTPLQAGLFYLAPGCGYLAATFFGGRNADRVVKTWIRKRNGVRRPQDRLRAVIPWMGVGTPACMLIYGWCLEYNKGGIGLLVVVMFIQGFTQLMIFPAINTYCIDVVPGRSTEVLGGNFFIRYMFGAAGTALAIPATDGIGIGWFCTISAVFILCAFAGVMLVIYDRVPFAAKLNRDGTPKKETKPIQPDAEYDWLEAATAPECLAWAAAETKLATDHLDALPQKALVEERLRDVLAKEAAPAERQVAGKLFRLQKSADNPLGVFEVADKHADGTAGAWRAIIDIGALSAAEGKRYVFVDFDLQCRVLGPDATRVLLYLSDGGSDLIEVVEVDAVQGGVLAGGFRAGPDRLAVCYLGPAHILIQTSVTNGKKTAAGMPCTAFIWQRGTPLAEAKAVYTAPATDAISLLTSVGPPEEGRAIITRAIDYTTWAHYSVTLDGTVAELPLPRKQCLLVPPRTTAEHLVVSLVEAAVVRGVAVPAGAILACSVDAHVPEDERVSVVFAPGADEYTPHVVADGLQASRSRVMLTATKNGQQRRQLMQWDKASRTWSVLRSTPVATGSHLSLLGGDYYSETFVVSESGLLRPTHSWIETEDAGRAPFYTQPAVFDVDQYQLRQCAAISQDGTSVDYVLLCPKTATNDGTTPVLVTAYGVMGISMMLRHLDRMLGGASLVPWLESGGALAVALVRGGGEKGPAWHAAAQGVLRQKSYDDFIAVAEALVRSGLTASQHMGVFGTSGGGLLAAVMAVQRPDLFGAVVADVPMTDMLRFPLLGMGGAWVAEYGDPSDPAMVDAIRAYSPLHNIVDNPLAPYPPQLVTVSTNDDRVGVGHARKFVAKMKDAGAPDILLHEDSAGGHNVSDSYKNAQLMSRRVAFFMNRLQSSRM